MAVSTSDSTINPVIVVSGGTIAPFAALTINDDNIGNTSDVETAWAEQSFAVVPIGSFADPAGGGTVTMAGPPIGEFDEKATNTGVPTAGSSILQRLLYTAPMLPNGQFRQIIDAESVTDAPSGQFVTYSPPASPVIDIVTPPMISGTVANQPVGAPGTIKPFATVNVTDTDFTSTPAMTSPGPMDTAVIKVTDGGTATDNDGLLTGAGLSKTGVGTYSIPNAVSPASLTTELQALTLTAPSLFGTHTASLELDVTDVPPTQSTKPPGVDITKALTSTDTTTSVMEDGQPPPPPGNNFHIVDTSTGMATDTPGSPYNGPVVGIADQYIVQTENAAIDADNLNITAITPNVFIHSGTGTDALDVGAVNGNNILDGFTGSNFLVGGTGDDQFFLDDRNATADIFSTVRNLHSGDSITVWGVTQADFKITPGDNVLPTVPGLDIAITAPGQHNANIDIPNYTSAGLSNGQLVMSFGKTPDEPGLPGSNFMMIQAT